MGAPPPQSAMAAGGPDQDRLIVNQLRQPLLTEYLYSPELREDLLDIVKEIRSRWLAKVPKESNNLASTAQIAVRKGGWGSTPDRWEGEFSAGGPRAPYAVAVEEEGHYLREVLVEMGFSVNQFFGDYDTPGSRPVRPAPVRRSTATTGRGDNPADVDERNRQAESQERRIRSGIRRGQEESARRRYAEDPKFRAREDAARADRAATMERIDAAREAREARETAARGGLSEDDAQFKAMADKLGRARPGSASYAQQLTAAQQAVYGYDRGYWEGPSREARDQLSAAVEAERERGGDFEGYDKLRGQIDGDEE